MTLFRVAGDSLERVSETTFAQERLQERQDLQRLLRSDISVLQPDLMVVTQEFGEWEDSNRRIDLLCLDKRGTLVVVELKRSDDGGHMELQAVRYAAMVSSMTFEQLVSAHARYTSQEQGAAQASLLSFLECENAAEAALSGSVRIILVSANFSKEITTAVLWLNRQGLDITCYRIKPHKIEGQVLVDIQQLIPLPESADYETKLKAQRQETERAQSARRDIFLRFWTQLIARSRGRTSVVSNRSASSDHWLSGRIGRSGFGLSFVLNQHESQVECYITFGREGATALAAFEALRLQRADIEREFGTELVWEDLPGKLGCRISKPLDGGWRTPEQDWPELQDRMIDAMARLERALKQPISKLQLNDKGAVV